MSDQKMDPSRLAGPERLRRVDQIMEIVGIALLPLGVTALLVGWLGVASNGLVFLQLPYLVSGGMLGLGLVIASGAIYLASWISRVSAVQRRQNSELLTAVTELKQTMAALPVAAGTHAAASSNGHGAHLLATPGGSMFHRPDCAIVANREDTRDVDPDEAGMKPCGMCDPLGSAQDATAVLPSAN